MPAQPLTCPSEVCLLLADQEPLLGSPAKVPDASDYLVLLTYRIARQTQNVVDTTSSRDIPQTVSEQTLRIRRDRSVHVRSLPIADSRNGNCLFRLPNPKRDGRAV
jgi:hypothetical protein